ncbi:MAG: DMT family transporter, partial [Calditrichaeota bacterium]
ARKKAPWAGSTKKDLWVSILSGIFLAIHFGAWIGSLKLTSVTNSTVLVSTSPFWVVIISRLIFKTRIRSGLFISFLVAFTGVVFMTLLSPEIHNMTNSRTGDFWALIGAWGAAGYILCGRFVRKRMENLDYITIAYSVSGIILLVIAVLSKQQLLGFEIKIYGLLVLIALLPQLIGHSTFNWALKYLSAPLVSTLLLGEPIFASLLAWFFLNESHSLLQISGGILVVAGVAGAIWSET